MEGSMVKHAIQQEAWEAGQQAGHIEHDQKLAASARRDPQAFAQLYERYALRVYRYVISRVGQPESAEDITSQVFLEAWEHISKYRPTGTFASWLFTIAHRRCADYYRKRPASGAIPENIPSNAADPLTQVIQADDLRWLDMQLKALDYTEQEMLRLRFAAGLSFADVGALVGRSPAAAKTAIYRLLERLEQKLEASHE